MKSIEVIEVPDIELHKANESNAYNLHQGDLFRGLVVKGVVWETSRHVTNYLVTLNPEGWNEPVVLEEVKE